MKKSVLLLAAITLQGLDINAGETVELPEKSAQALINEGKAEAAEAAADTKQDDAPPAGDKAQETDAEKQRKALDDQYLADELKKAAKEAGVDFAYDVKKPELIAAIIEQGKVEALLK